jgi:Fe-S-cluster-containing hydrogenase component 2
MGYIANYGYANGSGEYYIVVDTGKCDGCGDCVEACPAGVLEVIEDDYGDMVVSVTEEHRRKIKYSCAPCKPTKGAVTPPCLASCTAEAMSHSW